LDCLDNGLLGCYVTHLMGYFGSCYLAAGLQGTWAIWQLGYLVVALFGCETVWLLGFWTAGLLGCMVGMLLEYWIAGLPGNMSVGLFSCWVIIQLLGYITVRLFNCLAS
jgi:hypothetical protein